VINIVVVVIVPYGKHRKCSLHLVAEATLEPTRAIVHEWILVILVLIVIVAIIPTVEAVVRPLRAPKWVQLVFFGRILAFLWIARLAVAW
jgi:formate hydrogenlyase subunit 4